MGVDINLHMPRGVDGAYWKSIVQGPGVGRSEYLAVAEVRKARNSNKQYRHRNFCVIPPLLIVIRRENTHDNVDLAHRITSSPNPISSTPTFSHHPSSTRLPPNTPCLFPNPRPLPLLFPAQISKNLTVWSQQAMIRLPSSSVRLAHGSPSPRRSLR